MINTKELKVSRRLAIILLIVVFSIAGIVACAGDDITGSGRGNSYTQTPVGPTGPTSPTTNTNSGGGSGGGSLPGMDTNDTWEMPKPNWGDDTYYTIYIPFMGRTNVSYKDTTTLNTLYRRFIERGLGGKGGRWFIKDGGNTLSDPTQGSYYYFDKDLNIRYGGNTYAGYHKRLMKKFLGAVIVDYSSNNREDGIDRGRLKGTWSLGGLYETMVSKKDDPDYGQGYWQYSGPDANYLRIFMGNFYERTRGHVEVVIMNEGYADGNYNEFGADIYMCTTPKNAYTGTADVEYKQAYYAYKSYLGANPAVYTKKLHTRTNLAFCWGKYALTNGWGHIVERGYQKFTYFSARPSAWHLE